jgi:hypothetical protein
MQTYPIPRLSAKWASKITRSLFFLSCFLPVSLFAQDSLRIRQTLNELCSSEMAGRGYLENGHKKAARYIKDRFAAAGLKPLPGGYLQPFPMSAVLFPKEPELHINGRKLEVGKDFLPPVGARPLKGRFSLSRTKSSQTGGKSIQIWEKGMQPVSGGIYFQVVDKLTHSVATEPDDYWIIPILKSALRADDSLVSIHLVSRWKQNFSSQNVLAWAPGTVRSDSFLMVCAHYDHLGKIGKTVVFSGANDNASGVSLLLDLAERIQKNPLRYSVVFIAFGGEEAGLLGSSYFVSHPIIDLKKIRFVFNLDLEGFGDQGATVVNATLHPKDFERLKTENQTMQGLVDIKSRGPAANSDHYPFSQAGVPAFFLYSLGGPGHYHDIYDVPSTVSLAKVWVLHQLIYGFLAGF